MPAARRSPLRRPVEHGDRPALFLSETTVKTHLGHVFTKLGSRDRAQAVVLAYESGLVEPGAAG